MKRIEQNQSVVIPPVRLYLDHIEFLLQRLSEDMDTQIRHADFAYDSIDELKNHVNRTTITQVTLVGRRRDPPCASLTVSISPDEVRIWADNSSVADRASSIAEYLRTHVQWYSWRPGKRSNYWYGIEGFLWGVIVIGGPTVIALFAPVSVIPKVVMAAIVFLVGNAFLLNNRVWIGGSRIYLFPTVSKESFWERNREKIIASLVSSALVGFAGYLIGRITK